MSIKSMLTDRCDIYHLTSEETTKPTYGVPTTDFQVKHTYDSSPDHIDVHSYFAEVNQTIVQAEPDTKITEIMRATFLIGTDIRKSDKIVFDGTTYIAQKPRKIKNSHIEVKVKRVDSL